MSAPPPLPCVWTGEVFRPLPNFIRVAAQHYGAGEVVPLIPHEERSAASHRHFFALVNEAWQNLPEHLAHRHPSADHLRKFALIQTGFRVETTFVCKFKTEAIRLAAAMSALDTYAVIVVDGKIVTRMEAESQSMQAMGKMRFQESKDAVLAYLSDLIGVDVQQLSAAGDRAGASAPVRRELAA